MNRVMRVVMVLATVLVASGAAQMAVTAPVTVAAVSDTRDRAPAADAPFYGVLVAEDADGEATDPLPEVEAPTEVERQAFYALIRSGARGAVNDTADAVYARVGTVLDFGAGTVTVTMFGPAICEDGPGSPCSGAEFLGAEFMTF